MLLLLLVLVAGCPSTPEGEDLAAPGSDEPSGEPSGVAAAEAPVEPAELPDDPVYTWYDARGRAHLASSIEEVPVSARGSVVVSRLGGGAEVALAEAVTVGDYRKATPSYSTVDLVALSGNTKLDGDALLDHQKVYVYSAVWCGFCTKVKEFLQKSSIPFTERDIEKDSGAAAELAAKLEAVGLGSRGIPVTDIHGELIVGFKPTELEERLTEVGAQPKPKPEPDEREIQATPKAAPESP